MLHTVNSDSAIKVNTPATIQNRSRIYNVAISNSPNFTEKIILYPLEYERISGIDSVYLRCDDEGKTAKVVVIENG